MTTIVRVFLVCVTAISAAGCGGGSPKGTVTGMVKVDGVPLKEGTIRFVPADGLSQTADANIVNGQFKAEVPPGEKRVEISAPKVIGKHEMYDTPDSPVVDDVVELLPPEFNVQSKLTMKVEHGPQEKSFDVTTK